MKKIIFIRHAQSVANTNRKIVGGRSNETPLSTLGEEQAKDLGLFLLNKNIIPDRIFSSPAIRTMETARISLNIVNSDLIKKIETSYNIQEMTHGSFEGKLRTEVYSPEVQKEIELKWKDFRLDDPKSESMNDVAKRMKNWVNETVGKMQDGEVGLVYGYGIAICCYLSDFLNLSQKETIEMISNLPNASLTTVVFSSNNLTPEIINIGEKK